MRSYWAWNEILDIIKVKSFVASVFLGMLLKKKEREMKEYLHRERIFSCPAKLTLKAIKLKVEYICTILISSQKFFV